ncbi:MAG: hypothetical protein WBR29_01100 [Gammaproteobacteria bacterium]
MTLTQFMIAEVVSGGLFITMPIFLIVRFERYKRTGFSDMLAVFMFLGGMFVFTALLFYTDDPGLYTRTLGPPQEAKVEGLTYIGGSLLQDSLVRVDTDKGSFLFDTDALIPHTGQVYLVRRQRPWGDPRLFLCLTPKATQCWAESQPRD